MNKNLDSILVELKGIRDENLKLYGECCDAVAKDLGYLLSHYTIKHMPVTSRVKEWGSIEKSLERRQEDRIWAQEIKNFLNKYPKYRTWEKHCRRYKRDAGAVGHFQDNTAAQAAIPDIIGVRVALYFPADLDKVIQILEEAGYKGSIGKVRPKRMGGLNDIRRLRKLEEVWLEDCKKCELNSKCKDEDKDNLGDSDSDSEDLEKQFSGYNALHWVVQAPKRLDLFSTWAKLRVEVQIGTVLMHAWSEVDHDITYKELSGKVTHNEKRVLDIVNGLAIAAEVALRGLKSPAEVKTGSGVAPDLRFESIESLTNWLRGFHAARNNRAPAAWTGVKPLFQVLQARGDNTDVIVKALSLQASDSIQRIEAEKHIKLENMIVIFMLDLYSQKDFNCPRSESSVTPRNIASQIISAYNLAAIFDCSNPMRDYIVKKLLSHARHEPELTVFHFLDLLHPKTLQSVPEWNDVFTDGFRKMLDRELSIREIIDVQLPEMQEQRLDNDGNIALDYLPQRAECLAIALARIILVQTIIRLAKKGFVAWPIFRGGEERGTRHVFAVPGNMILNDTIAHLIKSPFDRPGYDGSQVFLLDSPRDIEEQSIPAQFCERLILRPLEQTGDHWQLLCEKCHGVEWTLGHIGEPESNEAFAWLGKQLGARSSGRGHLSIQWLGRLEFDKASANPIKEHLLGRCHVHYSCTREVEPSFMQTVDIKDPMNHRRVLKTEELILYKLLE